MPKFLELTEGDQVYLDDEQTFRIAADQRQKVQTWLKGAEIEISESRHPSWRLKLTNLESKEWALAIQSKRM